MFETTLNVRLRGNIFEKIDELKSFIDGYLREMEKVKLDNVNLTELGIKRVETKQRWYLECLEGKKVVGVDGSQINPLRELGIPIGVVQVAKVKVWHGEGKKDVEYYSMPVTIDENINLKRFDLEMEALIDEVGEGGWLFFDGSFMAPEVKDNKNVEKLFRLSEEHSTPVIGYVDKSFSRDLSDRLGLKTYDSFLLRNMKVFEYTKPFIKNNLAYAYIKLNPALPARIEYPVWMVDMHDDVVKLVIAECQLGITKGYPYILERAHKFSTIEHGDRAKFMRAVKSYSVSFKWMAKMR
ncbi:hypothetical protein DRP05_06530 [Archaeoglobales archaeon]|nr:MAG: hypothetical protein DRP05_06530 [Archaeoglobales archaeon]